MKKEITWPEVLSPKVDAFIKKFGGQGITPALFKECLEEINGWTLEEKLQLCFFQCVMIGRRG